MFDWFVTRTTLSGNQQEIARRPYGVIEAHAGAVAGLHFRPWPTVAGVWDVLCLGRLFHACSRGDRAWLYYNECLPGYLAISYAVSTADATLRTIRAALATLDRVAEWKGTDAIVCEATWGPITDRIAARFGYERHLPDSLWRHYIRRFYGAYPAAE